jgi:hypothetical protein
MPTTPLEFRTRTSPKNPLSHERILRVCHAYRTLHNAFIRAGGEITSELYATMLEIDREIITWEQRSSRLHYAARKQSEARARKRDEGVASHQTNPLDDLIPTETILASPNDDFTFDGPSDATNLDSTILPDATKSALAKYKAERIGTIPTNSDYKKSGLV